MDLLCWIIYAICLIFLFLIFRDSFFPDNYYKSPRYNCSPCEIKPSPISMQISYDYIFHNRFNVKRFFIISICHVLALSFSFFLTKYPLYILSTYIFIVLSSFTLYILISIHKEHSFYSFVVSRVNRIFSFPFLTTRLYNKSGFRFARYVVFRRHLYYSMLGKKIKMHGIHIFRKPMFYKTRLYAISKYDIRFLEPVESPEMSGIYTIVEGISSDINLEIYSDQNEVNHFTNFSFYKDLYRLYTQENSIGEDKIETILNYLNSLYNAYSVLLDLRLENGILYIRSYNYCLITNNLRRKKDDVNDFACNLQYFDIQNNLIKFICDELE